MFNKIGIDKIDWIKLGRIDEIYNILKLYRSTLR